MSPALSHLTRAALSYSQEYGLLVFPVHTVRDGRCSCGLPADEGGRDGHSAGKHPRPLNGLEAATTHPDAIADWWTREPNDNIGVRTGAASNLVVVDVDGPAGETALVQYGTLPRTVTAVTGREGGGRHLYFAHPGSRIPNSASKLGPMLDVRGDGGYVIAPPSRHPSGRCYEWASGLSLSEVELAPLPAAMIERLDSLARQNDRHRGPVPLLPGLCQQALVRRGDTLTSAVERNDRRVRAYLAHVGPHKQGSRNAAAFQVAAWLVRDFGLSPRTAAAYLEEWNADNQPPLGARELRDVLASAIRHGQRGVGSAHLDGARGVPV